jgi:hypothetical protein
MEILGVLPASNSPQFSLNKLDWKKILRFTIVQAIGLLISLGPMLLCFRYVIGGHDYTQIAVILINGGVEAGRRYISPRPKD